MNTVLQCDGLSPDYSLDAALRNSVEHVLGCVSGVAQLASGYEPSFPT